MNDQEAFIRAIAHQPHDEAPRLIFADWLEEHERPHEADYLRTELALAKLPLGARQAGVLRARLWQAWAVVDPAFLMTFTQPRMLRANPTPFDSVWINFGLGDRRPTNNTYADWPYHSLPELPFDEFRGEFQYLRTSATTAMGPIDAETLQFHRQGYRQMLQAAKDHDLKLPKMFEALMADIELQNSYRSVTDCYYTTPSEDDPIRQSRHSECFHVPFYSDSQACVLWDLYLHSNGAHCVIARTMDYFEGSKKAKKHPQAWFVAPSLQTFVYRIWVENMIWYEEHDERQTAITPAIRAYIDHY